MRCKRKKRESERTGIGSNAGGGVAAACLLPALPVAGAGLPPFRLSIPCFPPSRGLFPPIVVALGVLFSESNHISIYCSGRPPPLLPSFLPSFRPRKDRFGL